MDGKQSTSIEHLTHEKRDEDGWEYLELNAPVARSVHTLPISLKFARAKKRGLFIEYKSFQQLLIDALAIIEQQQHLNISRF